MNTISLDLTPWIRGPFSGVGLTAARTARALADANSTLPIRFVSRVAPPQNSFLEVRQLSPLESLLGNNGDIFHSLEPKLPAVMRSRKIITVHDCWTLHPNAWQSEAFQIQGARTLKRAIRRADAIVVPSHATKAALLRWNPSVESITRVVHWGPMLGTSTDGSPSESVQLHLQEKRPFLLMVAVLESRKNHALLFRAMQVLASATNSPDLVLVGARGHGHEAVLRMIEDAPFRTVHFERLDEASLAPLYDNALAVVLPSFDEGFGLPVLEAMARRKPVLISRIPALLEIGPNEPLAFDPHSGEEELAAHIRRLIDDHAFAEAYAETCFHRSRDFGWDRVAAAMMGMYREMG